MKPEREWLKPNEYVLLERCSRMNVDCRIKLTGGGWALKPPAVLLAVDNLIESVDKKRPWLMTITPAGRKALEEGKKP